MIVIFNTNLKVLNDEETKKFSERLAERISNLIGWGYSYSTNEFYLEVDGYISEEEAKNIVENVVKELFG